MNVAIIPARAGSKRIPDKNIKTFLGQPMISWSIKTAIDADCFDEIIVSTDSDQIAEIALCYGATVPFLRPAELADDFVPLRPVMQHAIEVLEKTSMDIDYVCCLAATAPLLSTSQLRLGYKIAKEMNLGFLVSVGKFSSTTQRALRLSKDGKILMIEPKNLQKRSQDFEETFFDACQFYWASRNTWMSDIPIFSEHSQPLVLPRHEVQDIDTEEDWLFAEQLFSVACKV